MPSRTDELLSKGMGVAKDAKAMFKGLHGVFRTLMEQHGEVSALLRRCKADADKRADLWPKIRIELLSHERAELREVYPVLRDYEEIGGLVATHDREATELERQIARIDALSFDSSEWGRELELLSRLVDDHIALEESEIFPTAEELIGEDRANELDAAFRAAKKQMMATA